MIKFGCTSYFKKRKSDITVIEDSERQDTIQHLSQEKQKKEENFQNYKKRRKCHSVDEKYVNQNKMFLNILQEGKNYFNFFAKDFDNKTIFNEIDEVKSKIIKEKEKYEKNKLKLSNILARNNYYKNLQYKTLLEKVVGGLVKENFELKKKINQYNNERENDGESLKYEKFLGKEISKMKQRLLFYKNDQKLVCKSTRLSESHKNLFSCMQTKTLLTSRIKKITNNSRLISSANQRKSLSNLKNRNSKISSNCQSTCSSINK